MDPIPSQAAERDCRGRDLTRDFRIRQAEHARPMRRRLLARPAVASEPSGKLEFRAVVPAVKLSSSSLAIVSHAVTGLVLLSPCVNGRMRRLAGKDRIIADDEGGTPPSLAITGSRVTGRLGTAEVGKMRIRGTVGTTPGPLCNAQRTPPSRSVSYEGITKHHESASTDY